MAVTIDQMQVDVQRKEPEPQTPAASTSSKEPVNVRQQIQIIMERQLRLKAN